MGMPLACASRENDPQRNSVCLLHLEGFLIQIGATQHLPGTHYGVPAVGQAGDLRLVQQDQDRTSKDKGSQQSDMSSELGSPGSRH